MKDVAITAARKVGELLRQNYGKTVKFSEKDGGSSLVSEVDLASEKIIMNEIKTHFPKHNIVSEESSPIHNKSEFTWYIDPIDGTHNFLRGLPTFGVSIGVGGPNGAELGVMYMPIFDYFVIAEKGKGAFLNDERLQVSDRGGIAHGSIVMDCAFKDRMEKMKILEKITTPHNDRMYGCAVYDAILVAQGKAEAFITFNITPWDIAAGFLIIEEAGGKATNFKGEKWDYSKQHFVASNGRVHQQVLDVVNG